MTVRSEAVPSPVAVRVTDGLTYAGSEPGQQRGATRGAFRTDEWPLPTDDDL